MRYIKPAVVSCSMASKSVMGVAKMIQANDNSVGNPLYNTASAYESDE